MVHILSFFLEQANIIHIISIIKIRVTLPLSVKLHNITTKPTLFVHTICQKSERDSGIGPYVAIYIFSLLSIDLI